MYSAGTGIKLLLVANCKSQWTFNVAAWESWRLGLGCIGLWEAIGLRVTVKQFDAALLAWASNTLLTALHRFLWHWYDCLSPSLFPLCKPITAPATRRGPALCQGCCIGLQHVPVLLAPLGIANRNDRKKEKVDRIKTHKSPLTPVPSKYKTNFRFMHSSLSFSTDFLYLLSSTLRMKCYREAYLSLHYLEYYCVLQFL